MDVCKSKVAIQRTSTNTDLPTISKVELQNRRVAAVCHCNARGQGVVAVNDQRWTAFPESHHSLDIHGALAASIASFVDFSPIFGTIGIISAVSEMNSFVELRDGRKFWFFLDVRFICF